MMKEKEALSDSLSEKEKEDSNCFNDSSQMENANQNSYSSSYFPELQLDVQPECFYLLRKQFLNPLNLSGNFLKGVKWSPDGNFFLTSTEDTCIRSFTLPFDSYYSQPAIDLNQIPSEDSLSCNLNICEGETVYDFSWYPLQNYNDLSTCVFATSSRDHPIHLWDAMTGNLRCTYRAYDMMDEITSAFSLSFNPHGNKLMCGYNKVFRKFDVDKPGREYIQHSTVNSNKEGQRGILSSINYNPSHHTMFAAGSYDGSVGIYNDDNFELLFLVQRAHEYGLTHMKFSNDGNYLYTGGRKDPNIYCWDMRNSSEFVYKMERLTTSNNQKFFFDIDQSGKFLATGGEDGYVKVFDLQTGHHISSFFASSDYLNGIHFHPHYPIALTCSGQRRFVLKNKKSMDEENEKEEEEEDIEYIINNSNDWKSLLNCVGLWRFACSWKLPTSINAISACDDEVKDDDETIIDIKE